jgi:hypothetical protein
VLGLIYQTLLHNIAMLEMLFEQAEAFVWPVFIHNLCAPGRSAYKILTAATFASEPVKMLPINNRLTLFTPLIIITTIGNLSFELRERCKKEIGLPWQDRSAA